MKLGLSISIESSVKNNLEINVSPNSGYIFVYTFNGLQLQTADGLYIQVPQIFTNN